MRTALLLFASAVALGTAGCKKPSTGRALPARADSTAGQDGEACALLARYGAARPDGWREEALLYAPSYTVLLPPGLAEDTSVLFYHGGRTWRGPDSLQVDEVYGMWGEASFGEPDSVAAWGGRYHACTLRYGPTEAFVVATGGPEGYGASAWIRQPAGLNPQASGHELVLGVSSPDSTAVPILLAMVQSLHAR